MTGQQLYSEAMHFVMQLKKEDFKRNSGIDSKKKRENKFSSYSSFAQQVIILLNNGQVSTKEQILDFADTPYPRARLNGKWKIFKKVIKCNLNSNLNKGDLLYFFGYLKRLLFVIEKKRKRGKEEDRHLNGRQRPSYYQKMR